MRGISTYDAIDPARTFPWTAPMDSIQTPRLHAKKQNNMVLDNRRIRRTCLHRFQTDKTNRNPGNMFPVRQVAKTRRPAMSLVQRKLGHHRPGPAGMANCRRTKHPGRRTKRTKRTKRARRASATRPAYRRPETSLNLNIYSAILWFAFAFCQNTRMRIPSTKQPKESPRNHRTGILTISPVIPQTTPRNTEAKPVNGISTGYFIGFRAKMIKYTPIIAAMAWQTWIIYSNSGASGKTNDSSCGDARMPSE